MVSVVVSKCDEGRVGTARSTIEALGMTQQCHGVARFGSTCRSGRNLIVADTLQCEGKRREY